MNMSLNVALDQAFRSQSPGRMVVLYGVRTNAAQALPAAWQVLGTLLPVMSLSFPLGNQTQAFMVDTTVGDGSIITPPSCLPLDGGQTFLIPPDLSPTIQAGGPAGLASFANRSGTQLTVGFGVPGEAGVAPVFAAPLAGQGLIQASAGPYAVLFFADTNPVAGQLIGKSPYTASVPAMLPDTQILRLDLSALSGLPLQTVSYAANTGWQLPSGAVWGKTFPATSDLVALTILPLAALSSPVTSYRKDFP